jgi:hypothetical protein
MGQLSLRVAERKRAAIAKCIFKSLGHTNDTYLALGLTNGAYLYGNLRCRHTEDAAISTIAARFLTYKQFLVSFVS